MQDNPVIPDLDVPLAENEQEILLLELFPMSARSYLTRHKHERAASLSAVSHHS